MRVLLLCAPLLLALAFAAFAAAGVSGAAEAHNGANASLAERLPCASLAWIPTSRAARSPSTEERGAQRSDDPSAVDADPASGTLFFGGARE
jgi:hypothetical protein